jgi:hypothetical protein
MQRAFEDHGVRMLEFTHPHAAQTMHTVKLVQPVKPDIPDAALYT